MAKSWLVFIAMALAVAAVAWWRTWEAREISLAAAVVIIVYLLWRIKQGDRTGNDTSETYRPGESQAEAENEQWGIVDVLPAPNASEEERRVWLDNFLIKQQDDNQ